MKILFAGGGTMGSVTPLIAVAESLKAKNPGSDLYWIGTKGGPEEKTVRYYNINFKAIYSGKLRRYFSWQNFWDVFRIILGFIQALVMLKRWKPQVIVSAGGFVAVPVVWAGWLLGIKSVIHQQDVRVGLANKLCSWPAEKMTVCFAETQKFFRIDKTEVIGNPIRDSWRKAATIERERFLEKLNLKKDWPVVLVTTGGTGSFDVNQMVVDARKELVKFCQVIHVTGRHKTKDYFEHENYISCEFLVDLVSFFRVADLIVTRAGMAALTEISYLSKPAIIIPIPQSHQEDNADYFQQRAAAKVLAQEEIDSDDLVKEIRNLLNNKNKLKEMGKQVHEVIQWGAERRLAEIILEVGNR